MLNIFINGSSNNNPVDFDTSVTKIQNGTSHCSHTKMKGIFHHNCTKMRGTYHHNYVKIEGFLTTTTRKRTSQPTIQNKCNFSPYLHKTKITLHNYIRGIYIASTQNSDFLAQLYKTWGISHHNYTTIQNKRDFSTQLHKTMTLHHIYMKLKDFSQLYTILSPQSYKMKTTSN